MNNPATESANPLYHGVKLRPTTQRLLDQLFLDLPLDLPVAMDFGVDTPDKYRALKAVLLTEEDPNQDEQAVLAELRQRIAELDAALGYGARLNTLVKRYAPQYANLVHFHTSWDEIYQRPDEPLEP